MLKKTVQGIFSKDHLSFQIWFFLQPCGGSELSLRVVYHGAWKLRNRVGEFFSWVLPSAYFLLCKPSPRYIPAVP